MLLKRAIGPVVATALFLVIVVVAAVSFQSWWGTYSSGILGDVEESGTGSTISTRIQSIIGDELYFNNGFEQNLTINRVTIDGSNCNITGNITTGQDKIWLDTCLQGLDIGVKDIAVSTDKGVYSMKYNLKTAYSQNPTLDLRFDQMSNPLDFPFDSISFSRNSNATYLGVDGYLRRAPHNIITYSEQFDHINWTKWDGASVTANQVTAPDGTLTADLVNLSSNANARVINSEAPAVEDNIELIGSFYIRSVSGSGSFPIGAYDGNAAVGGKLVTINEEWQRVNVTFNVSEKPWMGGTVSIYPGNRRDVAGENMTEAYVWGAQLEANPSPSMYIQTASSANYSGPRLESDLNGNPKGLLIEEERTNLFVQSGNFSDSAWGKTQLSISTTSESISSFDDAYLAIENTNNDYHHLSESLSLEDDTYYTLSVFAKSYGSNIFLQARTKANDYPNLRFNLENGSFTQSHLGIIDYNATSYGDGWYRVYMVFNSSSGGATTTMYIGTVDSDGSALYTGDGTSGIYIYGVQLEEGSFPTSYIPTNGSTQTRDADDVWVPDVSWFDEEKGTMLSVHTPVNGITRVSGNLPTVYAFDAGSWNERLALNINGSSIAVTGGSVISSFSSVEEEIEVQRRVAYAFQENNYGFSMNGNTTVTDNNGGMPDGFTSLRIGRHDRQITLHSNVHINRLSYWPYRISNEKLQLMTED